jgi:choline dehydrogenase-like flavoprotein
MERRIEKIARNSLPCVPVADYVIVGAGSAGCVLAETLSTRHSVALIEAGGDDRAPEVAIPAAFSKLFQTSRDWGLTTEAEPNASGRSLYLPRGKILGGSSSMNAMLYVRGRPSDYDTWESSGATGWDWGSVLPYFVAMEGNVRGDDQFHGSSGPLRVEDIRRPNELSRAFVEAAMSWGLDPNRDFNGATSDGVGFFQLTQKRGRRWSGADAFLRPAMARPTLEVITGAMAGRVVLTGNRATGVEYHKDGEIRHVEASREVIVAAGTYGSPHLLQLSGVGDPDHLRSVGIEPIVSNPGVGRNLQDHPVAGVLYETSYPGTLDDAENLVEMARWFLFRSGRLTSPVAEAGAFVRSSPEIEEPDLQFHFGPVNFDGHGLAPFDGHAFTIGPVLVNPTSRGTVMARTPDPATPPSIVTNCLSDPLEVNALIRGIEIAREIVEESGFDPFRGAELKPGREVRSHEDLEQFVRDNVELLYHPVGTCRMGSDDGAVIDPDLRVNGTEGLRVVDASVMPRVISGNTNAPTMMIAARAADLILT